MKAKPTKDAPRTAQLADIQLGKRIRERRLQTGFSQQQLADAVGVSFQQIQKYEKGTNRVTAARLERIAKKLFMNVTDFWPKQEIPSPVSIIDVKDKNALRLIQAYTRILDMPTKRKMVELVEALAEGQA